jgi:DNA-binding Lrp family transcriptional regulator
MSCLLPDFLIIPYEVAADKKLQSLDKVLYGVIYWYEHLHLKKCTASNPELARILHTTPLVVANSLKRLEAQGYVKRLFKDKARKHRLRIKALVVFRKVSSIDNIVSSADETTVSSIDEQRKEDIREKELEIPHAIAEVDVREIIHSFKQVNPTHYQLFRSPAQRAAVKRMLSQFGRSHLEALIAILPQTNAERYAPTITTPFQLERDMGRLAAFLKRKESEGSKLIHL